MAQSQSEQLYASYVAWCLENGVSIRLADYFNRRWDHDIHIEKEFSRLQRTRQLSDTQSSPAADALQQAEPSLQDARLPEE